MKKALSGTILSLVVISGLVLASQKSQPQAAEGSTPVPASAAESNAERKKWEASPDGIRYMKWETSPGGQKVLAAAAKIRKHTTSLGKMEGVVTSLSLPPGSRLGFGLMVRIDGDDHILSFGLEESDEFRPLRSLKVNDTLMIKSKGVSWAPKYAYPIVSAASVERDGKVLYKRAPRKGGC